MCAEFLAIQVLDGFPNTRDNVAGLLTPLWREVGFTDVTEPARFNTIFGTLALYSAKKPVASAMSRAPRGRGGR